MNDNLLVLTILLGASLVGALIIAVALWRRRKPNTTYLVVNDNIQQQLDDIVSNTGKAIEANALNRLRQQLETDPALFAKAQAYSVETELAAYVLIGDAIKGDIATVQKELTKQRRRVAEGSDYWSPDVTRLEQELDHLMTKLRAVGGKVDNVVALQSKS